MKINQTVAQYKYSSDLIDYRAIITFEEEQDLWHVDFFYRDHDLGVWESYAFMKQKAFCGSKLSSIRHALHILGEIRSYHSQKNGNNNQIKRIA